MDATHKSITTLEQANFHHLVMETMWFGIAAVSTNQFLSIFAIRLGATPIELGWLESLPAIVLLASTWLGSWWRNRSTDSVRAILWPTFGRRFPFILLVFTPLLPPQWQIAWLIFSISLPAVPQSIAAIINLVLWREAVGDHRLTSLVSYRSMAGNIATGLSGLAFGFWLENVPFPLNYQIMFGMAFLVALMSLWHIRQIKVVYPEVIPSSDQPSLHPWRSAGFQRVAIVAAVAYIVYYSMRPVIPLRLVNELGAGEGFMAVYGTIKLVAAVSIAMFTGRIADRIGNRNMMSLAMIGLMLEALILSFTSSLYITLLTAAVAGASWTATGIGLYGFLAEKTPAKTHFATAYQQTTYLATFIGPLIGSNLANLHLSLNVVLLVGAGLCFLAGALIQYNTHESNREVKYD